MTTSDIHIPKFGKTGFHELEEVSPSSEKTFKELMESGFVLEKRFKKDEKKFDVNCLLKILKKHKIFGMSFKDDLAKLYDDLMKAYDIVRDIHAIRYDLKKGFFGRGAVSEETLLGQIHKKMQLLSGYQWDIIRQEDKILTNLSVGYHELQELARRVELLKSDEKQILKWLGEAVTSNPSLHAALRRPLTDVTTDIQGALHKIYPLFEVVSKAYDEKLLKEVKNKISSEVNKINEFLKSDIAAVKRGKAEPVPEISFEHVLADIALIQGTVDDIIKDVESIKSRDHKFCKSISKNMQAVVHLMAGMLRHPKFEEFAERKAAWRKKHGLK